MEKTAIYGAGAYGKIFLSALEKEGIQIDFFIDENFSEEYCLSKRVYKSIDNKDAKIYISVLQYSKKIKEELTRQGFKNIIDFTASVKSSPFILQESAKLNHLWLIEDKDKMLNDAINDVKTLLSDNKSKTILDDIIKLRTTLDPCYYTLPEGTEYFPSDVPILDNLEEVRFVDCGAYTGDTIEALMEQNKKVAFSISFEPDPSSLLKLNSALKAQKKKFPSTYFFIYPSAVYSCNTILKFDSAPTSSSAAIDGEATSLISAVSLDETIFFTAPNYIKMDIEGAEKEAILGAATTIRHYKPNLAICLYHKPQDLWELPLLINEIEPMYDMYLRVHEDMGLSTVLYCIARK